MTPDLTGVIGAIGVIVTALFTYLGVRAKTKADKDIATAPDWQGFTNKIQEWTKEQLAERDAEIDSLRKEIALLKAIERKYGVALLHISQVHSLNPGIQPDIPFEIRQDLS